MTIRETLADAGPGRSRWDIKILATDLDSEVLGARPARPVRRGPACATLHPSRRERFFRETTHNGQLAYPGGRRSCSSSSRSSSSISMNPFPMKGPLDAIFCRNVVIYFDKDTQRDLFGRMAQLQRPGAVLFLGHSESLFKVSTDYSLIGKTIYRRV